MGSTSSKIAAAKAYTKVREFYRENRYRGGLIKTYTLVKTERLEDEVILTVPKGTKVTIKEQ